MPPLLTISLLLYKSEEYVTGLINSLVNQTDRNFEILIVDNASPDNSVSIAKSLLMENGFDNFKIVRVEKNTGCGQGRTVGYRNASCEYVKFLDSDDLLVEDYVEKINNEIRKNHPDVINYGHIVIDEEGHEIRRIPVAKSSLMSKYTLAMFWRYCFKRDLAITQDIDTSGLHYAEDRIFSLKLIPVVKKISIINDFLYKYTKRSNSTTKKVDPELFFESNKTVLELYGDLYNGLIKEQEKKVLFYQITKFYITSLIIPSKVNKNIFIQFMNKYKEIYLKVIGTKKYSRLWIIPGGELNKETLIIQIAYLLVYFKMVDLFILAFRRY